MVKLIAAMKKEFLLLIRDKMGLSILFAMPMVLIFVMTLIQDAAFKTLNEEGISLLFVNEDQDTLGNRIEIGLRSNELISFNDEIDGVKANREQLYEAVKEGKFLIGVVIPKGTTEAVKSDIQKKVFESLGEDVSKMKDKSSEIEIIVDPIASKTFVTTVSSQLREFISAVQTRIMFETFKSELRELLPDDSEIKETENESQQQVITYKEVYASELLG